MSENVYYEDVFPVTAEIIMNQVLVDGRMSTFEEAEGIAARLNQVRSNPSASWVDEVEAYFGDPKGAIPVE